MKKEIFVPLLVVYCISSSNLINGLAQQNNIEHWSKVGGFKLLHRGYGVLSTARHINKENTFTDYVNYYAQFALWIGAVNSNGEIFVTTGTGNAMSRRPEWAPKRQSFQVTTQTGFPQVEKISTQSFGDRIMFDGHNPLGLQVDQKIYGFHHDRFAIVDLAITLDSEAGPLNEVFVGFWGDVDAPDSAGYDTPTDDVLGFTASRNAIFIYDSKIKGGKKPLLGATILGTDLPIVSWWKAADDPKSDEQQYAYLKGDGPKINHEEPGDCRFLLSHGPFSLAADETVRFSIALVQAHQINAFENNSNAAQDFFDQELGGSALKKKSAGADGFIAETDVMPNAFRLYPNFPNPFNATTRIQFDLPEAAHAQLLIYNTAGQAVRKLVDEALSAGSVTAFWDGYDDKGQPVSSGIYFYKLQAGEFQAQRKLLLLK